MLQLTNITKDYITASETVHALKGVSISFRKKEFVSVLGPSGCGKTTLLNIIGGLDHYTSGDLVINGKSTKSYKDRNWDVYRNHRVGFIFQSYNLIPHQTVLGNVELALTIAGIGKKERTARAKSALDKVGLEGQYYKRPNQLSGGQCQRVAIARALVNDPEILLADEPTGALDTTTSVQIMELIAEIAKERLVIMVTHNPELAEQYSTRIVRFLDGEIIEDTNPMTDFDEYKERELDRLAKLRKKKSKQYIINENGKRIRVKTRRKENAKMSWFTAFKLSFVNLLSKKGRTTMVGIAGSIGIVGIAMVLAFSAGIKGYVASMQDDMLSGNPIRITETTYDLDALMNMMSQSQKEEIIKEQGKVFINSIVEYIAKMDKDVNSMIVKNNITEAYIKYIEQMPKEYYSALTLDYGIDMTNNIYTGFKTEKNGTATGTSIGALTEIYTSILKETDYAEYSSYITQIVPSFVQAPNSADYIAEQYDVVGKIATEKDEIMLVLDSNDRLSDVLLARLGYYAQDEFLNIVYKISSDPLYNASLYREYFTEQELLDKTFTWYSNDSAFTKPAVQTGMNPFTYNYISDNFTEEGLELKVVGILSTKEGKSYGSMSTGVYYTEALTKHVLEKNADTEIVRYMIDNEIDSFGSKLVDSVQYTYKYSYAGAEKEVTANVGQSLGLMESIAGAMGSMGSMGQGGGLGAGTSGGAGATIPSAGTGTSGTGSGTTNPGAGIPGAGAGTTNPGAGIPGAGGSLGGSSMMGASIANARILSLRNLGGNDLANDVSIYPISFDAKNLVTDYLDEWNGKGDVSVDGTSIAADNRQDITYTDALEIVIGVINTMIDAISIALIAFTSVSLVVSTVMIGIITYVSVVERIKEIGVIRSLGGRKRDVGNLFNCETFIIGLLSGLIGVGFTYIASIIISIIVKNLVGIPNIAQLPITQALLLIALSVILTSISGLIPARSAARKDPVIALRTE